ncbi:RDD family protein [Streptomyces sp. CA-111067]|uniref:RDD family protein n=1 Tax=Streptomyces sp. CA-111067 TaxID=3240046 RepID=UPI003D971104
MLPVEGGDVVVELAPAGARFAGAVIDLVVAAVSLAVPALAASGLQSVIDPDSNGYFVLGVWLLGYVWLTFYGAACVALWGGTPGLLLTGLRVARVWDGYERPTWAQALRRARFLAAMAWLIPLVNVVVVLVRLGNVAKERPYHHSSFDTIAGTVVIRRRPPTPVGAV